MKLTPQHFFVLLSVEGERGDPEVRLIDHKGLNATVHSIVIDSAEWWNHYELSMATHDDRGRLDHTLILSSVDGEITVHGRNLTMLGLSRAYLRTDFCRHCHNHKDNHLCTTHECPVGKKHPTVGWTQYGPKTYEAIKVDVQ